MRLRPNGIVKTSILFERPRPLIFPYHIFAGYRAPGLLSLFLHQKNKRTEVPQLCLQYPYLVNLINSGQLFTKFAIFNRLEVMSATKQYFAIWLHPYLSPIRQLRRYHFYTFSAAVFVTFMPCYCIEIKYI